MNSLDQALNEYIAIRRALGFELREVAGCLRNFVTFLKTEGASYITKEFSTPLGDSARGSSALHMGLAFGYGSALRRLAQCDGTAD
jgi:hypothetical protein